MEKINIRNSIFAIAENLAPVLEQDNLNSSFNFICNPGMHHLTVLITGTQIRIINPNYVLWVCSGSGDENKPNFLTPDAERMADAIEKVLKSSAEVTFWEMARTGREQYFWYSGPYFDNDLLLWDSYVAAHEIGTHREILLRLWSSDYEMLDQRAQQHVSPYMFAYERRGGGFGWLWYKRDESAHEIESSGQTGEPLYQHPF